MNSIFMMGFPRIQSTIWLVRGYL